MKYIHPRDSQGKKIAYVYCREWGEKRTSGTIVPSSKFLLNFNLAGKKGRGAHKIWLVLDPYGDETLPENMRDRFFGKGSSEEGMTVAIARDSGSISVAHFGTEKGKLFVFLTELSLRIPEPYLSRIEELTTQKRPYRFTLPDWALFWFLECERSYGDLLDDLVIELRFRNHTLQLSRDSYREVSAWEPLPVVS